LAFIGRFSSDKVKLLSKINIDIWNA
jgi:hypothetical protein